MKELTTDRLTLRRWTFSDADFCFDMYSRWEVQRFIGTVPRAMEERGDAVKRIARWRELDDPVLGIWAIEVTGTDDLVGTLLLKSIPASGGDDPLEPSGDIEIGWHLHPDAWGNGYAAEAARAVLAHAFESGLDRVVAVTNPANGASQRVARRIGMDHLGTTDDYYDAHCELFAVERPVMA